MKYSYWLEEKLRSQWMPLKAPDKQVTEHPSLHIAWADGHTRVSVVLYAMGDNKAQMLAQHVKVEDAAQAAEWKDNWSERLQALKALLA